MVKTNPIIHLKVLLKHDASLSNLTVLERFEMTLITTEKTNNGMRI